MAKLSKKKKLEILEVARDEERKKIVKYLTDEELYYPSITPLLENYLDAFVIYNKNGFIPDVPNKKSVCNLDCTGCGITDYNIFM